MRGHTTECSRCGGGTGQAKPCNCGTLHMARERVRKVAEGGMINTTYRMSPEPALDAFRADLLRILAE